MYKIAVVAKAFITPIVEGKIDMANAVLIDIEARTYEIDGPSQELSEQIAEERMVDELYSTRGGGPLWVAKSVAGFLMPNYEED